MGEPAHPFGVAESLAIVKGGRDRGVKWVSHLTRPVLGGLRAVDRQPSPKTPNTHLEAFSVTRGVQGVVLLSILAVLLAVVELEQFKRLWTVKASEGTDTVLFMERAINISSGVTPFVPVTMACLVFGLWVWCRPGRSSGCYLLGQVHSHRGILLKRSAR